MLIILIIIIISCGCHACTLVGWHTTSAFVFLSGWSDVPLVALALALLLCVCVLNVCVSRFLYVDQASLWKTSTKTARKGTQMPRKAGF